MRKAKHPRRESKPRADVASDYEHITSDRGLADLCRQLADAPTIAFDTEFVSEHTYRPQLCLIQVAAGERMAVIDPQTISDVTPFWELLASPGHETLVHAGREELLFCLAAVGRPPTGLFDVQIAAGLVGYEYPAGYGSLMYKLLGTRLHKGETRTDWRRRPLSAAQLSYALDDVRYLGPMAEALKARLAELERTAWLDDEMTAWQSDVAATRSGERWWRVSGASGLSRRSLAVVRELWRWREKEAEHRDSPTRRVLRDDLIIELAKRKSSDIKHIRAVRGMERRDLDRVLPSLAAAVERGLAVPDAECPTPAQREAPSQLTVLGQFLSTALSSICRAAHLAPSIVGTTSDVRELVAYRLGMGKRDGEPPTLGRGWRAEVVGRRIEDLLAGRLSMRIADPLSNEPLVFEPVGEQPDKAES
ncbi:MAG: ribonuclease D [Planctomycetota bacterium]|nr:MAG: ribonuclease D [Planctomycetota bacterium]